MRKLCLYLFLTTCSLSLAVQGQTNKDSILASKRGQVTINAGTGGSLIYLITQGVIGWTGFTTISTSPVVSLIGDYRFTGRTSIGLAVAYQATSGTPGNGDGDSFDNGQSGYIEYITKTDVGLRFLYHFSKRPDFDFYMGCRVGASFWTDYVANFPNFYYLARGAAFSVLPTIQILLGFQAYFSKAVGIHAEVAAGSPYFVEGGMTFRIKTKVKAPTAN